MTSLVPTDKIEDIVGVRRHATRHYARAVSSEQTVYILHSRQCVTHTPDLRRCLFSQALDLGVNERDWFEREDQPVQVRIANGGHLVPVTQGV